MHTKEMHTVQAHLWLLIYPFLFQIAQVVGDHLSPTMLKMMSPNQLLPPLSFISLMFLQGSSVNFSLR